MRKPLMPKATANWLIENTILSFDQISNFVGLHSLEVQAIADGEVSSGMLARNPIENGELMLVKWQDIHFIELDPVDKVYPLQERRIICRFIEE